MKSRRLLVKSVILGKEAPLSLVKTPLFVVPSGTLSARTGESAKLPVRARLSSFRSLWAVFRGGTLKLCPSVRSCARQLEVVPIS